jgi:hypothetical protein
MSATNKLLPVMALLLAISGCGSQVTVHDPTIPEPLIEKLPMRVAARYPDNFHNFVHEETVVGKEKWTIDLGASNIILFDLLFSSMFTDFQVIDADTDPKELGLDAFIDLNIDAFEFSVPAQSQSDEFAVWIRYRIKIYDSGGDQIANWPISAYGKSLTTFFSGDKALRNAAVLAMRDAAALIILQMDKATGISKLRTASNSTTTETAPPMPSMSDDSVIQTTATEEASDDSG